MESHEIEAWALRIADRVGKDQIEDARVELKARWPEEPQRAARRIAGHANSARSKEVLWIIGIDETGGTIVGADRTELATWWPKVLRYFDEFPPTLHDLAITVTPKTVVALLFECDRIPYVVNNPANSGPCEREVPWREGTAIRSARHSDLIRILSPMIRLPTFTVISAAVTPQASSGDTDVTTWVVEASLYVESSASSGPIVIPHFRCTAELRSSDGAWIHPVKEFAFKAAGVKESTRRQYDPDWEQPLLRTIRNGVGQLIIEGPGPMEASGRTTVSLNAYPYGVALPLELHVVATPVGADNPVTFDVTLTRSAGDRWIFPNVGSNSL